MLVATGWMRKRSRNASLAPREGRTRGQKIAGIGRGVAQRLKTLLVWRGAFQTRSAFLLEHRRADFGVNGPFPRRQCSVEWGQ
eukprot:156896-Chlamydomonas_euryale.AAC.2